MATQVNIGPGRMLILENGGSFPVTLNGTRYVVGNGEDVHIGPGRLELLRDSEAFQVTLNQKVYDVVRS
tara:strand:+ start:504 stop:710 length:207 start_codon:yes stop_codon:yes gene_type:complete